MSVPTRWGSHGDRLRVSDRQARSMEKRSWSELSLHHIRSFMRYQTDFQELQAIGEGGFGAVYKVRNKLDHCYYAVKKIKLSNKDLSRGDRKRLLREVQTLSKLAHQNVVRYYQAWVERGDPLKDLDAAATPHGLRAYHEHSSSSSSESESSGDHRQQQQQQPPPHRRPPSRAHSTQPPLCDNGTSRPALHRGLHEATHNHSAPLDHLCTRRQSVLGHCSSTLQQVAFEAQDEDDDRFEVFRPEAFGAALDAEAEAEAEAEADALMVQRRVRSHRTVEFARFNLIGGGDSQSDSDEYSSEEPDDDDVVDDDNDDDEYSQSSSSSSSDCSGRGFFVSPRRSHSKNPKKNKKQQQNTKKKRKTTRQHSGATPVPHNTPSKRGDRELQTQQQQGSSVPRTRSGSRTSSRASSVASSRAGSVYNSSEGDRVRDDIRRSGVHPLLVDSMDGEEREREHALARLYSPSLELAAVLEGGAGAGAGGAASLASSGADSQRSSAGPSTPRSQPLAIAGRSPAHSRHAHPDAELELSTQQQPPPLPQTSLDEASSTPSQDSGEQVVSISTQLTSQLSSTATSNSAPSRSGVASVAARSSTTVVNSSHASHANHSGQANHSTTKAGGSRSSHANALVTNNSTASDYHSAQAGYSRSVPAHHLTAQLRMTNLTCVRCRGSYLHWSDMSASVGEAGSYETDLCQPCYIDQLSFRTERRRSIAQSPVDFYHSLPQFLYIQMEYCEQTLRELMNSGQLWKRHSSAQIWAIFRQVTEGLAHIHSNGILHRDLKPANIMFAANGVAKIGDFGLAAMKPPDVPAAKRRLFDEQLDLLSESHSVTALADDASTSSTFISTATSTSKPAVDPLLSDGGADPLQLLFEQPALAESTAAAEEPDVISSLSLLLDGDSGGGRRRTGRNRHFSGGAAGASGDYLSANLSSAATALLPSTSTLSFLSSRMDSDSSFGENDFTTSIGTYLYCSPEMLNDKNQTRSYNEAVDLYSLGIILFELFYPFHTEMERGHTLLALRGEPIVFPADINTKYEHDQPELLVELITSLLQRDPSSRPSAVELLGMLPLCAHIEENPLLPGTLSPTSSSSGGVISTSPLATRLSRSLHAMPDSKALFATREDNLKLHAMLQQERTRIQQLEIEQEKLRRKHLKLQQEHRALLRKCSNCTHCAALSEPFDH